LFELKFVVDIIDSLVILLFKFSFSVVVNVNKPVVDVLIGAVVSFEVFELVVDSAFGDVVFLEAFVLEIIEVLINVVVIISSIIAVEVDLLVFFSVEAFVVKISSTASISF
jgi:hypothetical protein